MGVDHIKINSGNSCRVRGRPLFMVPEMRKDVMDAICEEAHACGRRVASHSQGSESETWAVQAGVDSLEHAHFISDETLRLMAESGTFLVPTMTHCVVNLRANPKEIYEIAYESMYQVIPKALQLGIRVTAGTDAGAGVPHGSTAMELELLTTVGMTPMEAIVAATGTAAEVLDVADSVGTLEKGKLADLLVVRGNPLEDIRLLQDKANITVVMKGGRVVVSRENS
jgi:imidazolonepropionase-like amidohydrolase